MICPRCDYPDTERKNDSKFGLYWHCPNCDLDFEPEDGATTEKKEDWPTEEGYYYKPE